MLEKVPDRSLHYALITSFFLSLQVPYCPFLATRVPGRVPVSPQLFINVKCVFGIIFELWNTELRESLGSMAWCRSNQTGWEHFQTHGSVDKRHVPGDERHSCPACFSLYSFSRYPFFHSINKSP
jgi:hypothetical protein